MSICIVCACCFVGSLWKPTVRRGRWVSSPWCQRAEVCLYCEGPAGVSACLLQVHLLCLGSASSRQLCRGESRETSRNLGGHILSERRLVGMHRVLKQQRIGWFVDSKVVRFNKAVCLQVWVIHSPPVPISVGQEVSLHVRGTCWTSPLFTLLGLTLHRCF